MKVKMTFFLHLFLAFGMQFSWAQESIEEKIVLKNESYGLTLYIDSLTKEVRFDLTCYVRSYDKQFGVMGECILSNNNELGTLIYYYPDCPTLFETKNHDSVLDCAYNYIELVHGEYYTDDDTVQELCEVIALGHILNSGTYEQFYTQPKVWPNVNKRYYVENGDTIMSVWSEFVVLPKDSMMEILVTLSRDSFRIKSCLVSNQSSNVFWLNTTKLGQLINGYFQVPRHVRLYADLSRAIIVINGEQEVLEAKSSLSNGTPVFIDNK
jgi:hypothetical protein